MKELSEKIPEEAGEGIELAAGAIRNEAKDLARVDTGYMRDHIGYYTIGKPTKSAVIESTAFYSQFQEYGTRYISPNYFMRGALEKVLPRCPEYVAEAIKTKVFGVGLT
jgi:HK97 gp10 family phage protein